MVKEWGECGRKADCYLFPMDFHTSQWTTCKVGEDKEDALEYIDGLRVHGVWEGV